MSVLDSVILVVADLAGLHPIIDEDIGQGPKAALDKETTGIFLQKILCKLRSIIYIQGQKGQKGYSPKMSSSENTSNHGFTEKHCKNPIKTGELTLSSNISRNKKPSL